MATMGTENVPVELGFVDKTESWQLLSHFFPSKVGGKPAWLALKPVPKYDDIKCRVCEKPCVFLAQIYAPITEKESCFHRTLFVFICRDPKCYKPNDSKTFVVLRSQLPKQNDFYDVTPPDEDTFSEDSDYPCAEKCQPLCVVCGCSGPKRCGGCHLRNYCCREHQIHDWKSGHKQLCGTESKSNASASTFLFTELDLVTETEEDDISRQEKSEEERMKEFTEYVEAAKGSSNMLSEKSSNLVDLQNMATGKCSDKQFEKFKKRIACEPEQVLRYQRGGEPLWVSADNKPNEKDIPDCQCGSKRIMEFQILPQLLIHLKVDSVEDSIDWGTLIIYTCEASCDSGPAYQQEFVWKQDFSPDQIS